MNYPCLTFFFAAEKERKQIHDDPLDARTAKNAAAVPQRIKYAWIERSFYPENRKKRTEGPGNAFAEGPFRNLRNRLYRYRKTVGQNFSRAYISGSKWFEPS